MFALDDHMNRFVLNLSVSKGLRAIVKLIMDLIIMEYELKTEKRTVTENRE